MPKPGLGPGPFGWFPSADEATMPEPESPRERGTRGPKENQVNKKQKREQARLEKEAQEQAQTVATETAAPVEVIEPAETEAGETVEIEVDVDKPDPNAAAKAQAEARRKAKAETAEKELRAKYPHVKEIVARGPNGPTRVRIECTDPQTKQVDGKAVSVCEGTREIAVQDLFQVTRCASCQDRVVRKARRMRQAKKDKALRKAARDLKEARG